MVLSSQSVASLQPTRLRVERPNRVGLCGPRREGRRSGANGLPVFQDVFFRIPGTHIVVPLVHNFRARSMSYTSRTQCRINPIG